MQYGEDIVRIVGLNKISITNRQINNTIVQALKKECPMIKWTVELSTPEHGNGIEITGSIEIGGKTITRSIISSDNYTWAIATKYEMTRNSREVIGWVLKNMFLIPNHEYFMEKAKRSLDKNL